MPPGRLLAYFVGAHPEISGVLLLDTQSLVSGHSMAMQCYHRLGNFDVKITYLIGVCLLFKVSTFCCSGACQFRTTEQLFSRCLNLLFKAG